MAQTLTLDPDPLRERMREIALALPEAAERLSHGMNGFHFPKGRFFAFFCHDLHGDGETAAFVKTSGLEEQAMLIEADPDFYYRPPYYGPSGWVAMRLNTDDVDWDRVADRIATSWELLAPRRLLEMGGR